MDLRNFIAQALLDIVGAVQDAQQKAPPGTVVPSVVKTFKAVEHGVSDIQSVEFDVTVRADQRTGSEARLSVVAAVVGGAVKGQSGKGDGHVATLRFRIPLRLPISTSR